MKNSVRQPSLAVLAMSESWQMITALLGGTKTMRDSGETYLPKWPNEESESYTARLKVATLYPAFSRTSDVLAAKPFSKPVTLSEDTPTKIDDWSNDVDLQGRNLHSFSNEVMRDCMSYGLSGVMVDYPKVEGVQTLADEKRIGARPYFTRYAPGAILGWKTQTSNGVEKLIQIRLLESVTEEDGEFGEKIIEQVRVLVPGSWATYRKMENKDDWIIHEEGTTTLSEIPFVFFYGIRKGYGISSPPLLDLAYLNVEHWQSSSDQQTILHVARVPILTIIGAENDSQITVGASSAVKLPLTADMKFVEHSGAAIEAGRASIADLEERMRQTGAELLVLKPGKVTATQISSDNEGNKCVLQAITENFEDALDQCLQFMAEWVGEAEGGSVTLFKDFGVSSLAEASAELLLKANQSGNLSDETFFSEMQRRGIISSDVEWLDEQERIGEQGPALGGITDPLPTVKPDFTPPTVDLAPVLSAIEAIQIPEPDKPEPFDDAPLVESLNAIKQQLTDFMSHKPEPAKEPTPVDLSPLEARIEELSKRIDEPQEAEIDLSPIQAQISALAEQVSKLAAIVAARPDPVVQQPPPVIIMDSQGNVKKQINIIRNEAGAIVGAETSQTVQ